MTLRVPAPRRCTDNGAMIAALGDLLVRAEVAPQAPGSVVTVPGAPLTGALVTP